MSTSTINRLAAHKWGFTLAIVLGFVACSSSGDSGKLDANNSATGGQSGQSATGGKGQTGGAGGSGGSSVRTGGGSAGGSGGAGSGGVVSGSGGGVKETGGVSGSGGSGSGGSGSGGEKVDGKIDLGPVVDEPAADKPAGDVGLADKPGDTGPITHRTLISGSGSLSIIGPDGKLEWTGTGGGYDCWLLPNGNIVHAYFTGAKEIKPDYVSGKGGTVIWDRPTIDGETHSCQPLEGDKFVITESHPGGISYIVEIDRSKTELKKLKIPFAASESAHSQLRQVRKLPSGNYLYCEQHGDGVEIDPTGKELHRYPGCTFEALRLANGNTLTSSGYAKQIIEYDQDLKVAWQVTADEFKAMGVNANFIAGVVRLENGDTVFSNYGASSADPNVFQITREKKIVWTLKQPKNAGDTGTTTACRILDGIPFPPTGTP